MDFFKDYYNLIDYDVSAFLIVLLESRFVFFDFENAQCTYHESYHYDTYRMRFLYEQVQFAWESRYFLGLIQR